MSQITFFFFCFSFLQFKYNHTIPLCNLFIFSVWKFLFLSLFSYLHWQKREDYYVDQRENKMNAKQTVPFIIYSCPLTTNHENCMPGFKFHIKEFIICFVQYVKVFVCVWEIEHWFIHLNHSLLRLSPVCDINVNKWLFIRHIVSFAIHSKCKWMKIETLEREIDKLSLSIIHERTERTW